MTERLTEEELQEFWTWIDSDSPNLGIEQHARMYANRILRREDDRESLLHRYEKALKAIRRMNPDEGRLSRARQLASQALTPPKGQP